MRSIVVPFAYLVAVLLACAVLLAIASGSAIGAETDRTADPTIGSTVPDVEENESAPGRIVEVYPNPPTRYDRGEYLLVELDRPGNWSVTDGYTDVSLPTTRTGTFAVTRDPNDTARFTDASIHEAPRSFRLADDGETLRLKLDGEPIDRVRYERAPESQRWLREEWGFRPDGFEPRPPARFGGTETTAFVLPDSPEVPIDVLESADERIYLGGYTLRSWRVAEALLAANRSGVDVYVLVDASPVGGISTEQAAILDTLVSGGVTVEAIGGDRSRFRFHHPKYAVVDDRAIVLTENWGPAGTGGSDSRGWGVVVSHPGVADELAAIYEHDMGWKDTIPWRTYRDRIDVHERPLATGSHPTHHGAETIEADSVTVFAAPDNAEPVVIETIDRANRRVDIKQPRIGSPDFPKLQAAIEAAERGVEVRILLSDAWYDEDANEVLARLLNERAEREGLPLEVRVDDPAGRYGKIHAKGVIADDTVVLKSVNWNNNSVHNNREIGVLLEGEQIAAYYRDVFDGDWMAGTEERTGVENRRPIGPIVLVGVFAAGMLYYAARTIEFEDVGY